jgi:hypothetical protein
MYVARLKKISLQKNTELTGTTKTVFQVDQQNSKQKRLCCCYAFRVCDWFIDFSVISDTNMWIPIHNAFKVHPFSIYTTKSSDFSNFCGVIGYNFFLL